MTRVLKLMFTEWLFSVVNTDTVYELERQIAKNYSIGGSCIACQMIAMYKSVHCAVLKMEHFLGCPCPSNTEY